MEREKEEKLFKKIMTENIQNVLKSNNLQVQVDQQTPSEINKGHIRVKMLKVKDNKRILKITNEKITPHFQGEPQLH